MFAGLKAQTAADTQPIGCPFKMPLGGVLVQRVKDGHLFYTNPKLLTEEVTNRA